MSEAIVEISQDVLRMKNGNDRNQLNGSLQALVVMLRDNFLPLVRQVYLGTPLDDDYERRPYGLVGIEHIQKLQALIDNRIAKVLQRLCALQAMRGSSSPRQITNAQA